MKVGDYIELKVKISEVITNSQETYYKGYIYEHGVNGHIKNSTLVEIRPKWNLKEDI